MLGQTCFRDSDCQFMNQCNNGFCQHKDIFPLTPYTVFIYIATGFACSLCNAAGSSMGLFKMLILVIALNYELGEATGLSQAMVVGTALPNFVSVILKKHPNGKTSLVNFRILEIMIPCCLLGSVLGAITETLTPKVAQLILIVLVFSYFVFTFTKKLRRLFKGPKRHKKEVKEQKESWNWNQTSQEQNNKQSLLQGEQNEGSLVKNQQKQENKIVLIKQPAQSDEQEEMSSQQRQLREYEKSYHVKQILLCVGLFVVFELLSFLAQGKLPLYDVDKCSLYYPAGLLALSIITACYVYWLRLKFKKVFQVYRKFNIQQQVYLDQKMAFYKVAVGSLAAGFIQGTLGLGGGTFIMMVLLAFNVDTTVASATSGYQILFTGLASLSEFYINGEVRMAESAWFLGICCLLGGCATLGLFYLIGKLDSVSVNKILIGIVLFLSLMSIFLTIPTGLRIYDADGWEGLSKIKFHCD